MEVIDLRVDDCLPRLSNGRAWMVVSQGPEEGQQCQNCEDKP
jgi:hypothetical protein